MLFLRRVGVLPVFCLGAPIDFTARLTLPVRQQLIAVTLHLFKGNHKTEVVQQQELQFKLVQLVMWQTTNFGVARVGVEYV
jgi:hypothetical protein